MRRVDVGRNFLTSKSTNQHLCCYLRLEEREVIEKSRLSPSGEVAVRIEKERRAKFDTAIIKGTQEENAYDELEELD